MRPRISTTVDGDLLERARSLSAAARDAELFDEALRALIAAHEDQALADVPYPEFATLPLGVPEGVAIDDYDGEAPADVVAYFRSARAASNT
jgi:hypothetical protein